MLSLYAQPETWWHRRSAGGKLLCLSLVCVALFYYRNLWGMAAVMLTSVAIVAALGAAGRRQLLLLWRLWPWWLGLLLLQAWAGQTELAVLVVCRWIALVCFATLVTMTTKLDAMLAVLERVLTPFRLLGWQTRRLSIVIMMMIRFIPSMLNGYDIRHQAWRARCSQPARWHLLAPWIVDTLRSSDQVALALRARGGTAGVPPIS